MNRLTFRLLVLTLGAALLVLCQPRQAIAQTVWGSSITQGPPRAPRVSVGGSSIYNFRRYSYGLPSSLQRRSLPNPLRYSELRGAASVLGMKGSRGGLPALSANPPVNHRTANIRVNTTVGSLAGMASEMAAPLAPPSLRSYSSAATPFPQIRVIHRNPVTVAVRPTRPLWVPIRDSVNSAVLQGRPDGLDTLRPTGLSQLFPRVSDPQTNPLLRHTSRHPVYRGMTGNQLLSPYHLYRNNMSVRLSGTGPRQSSGIPK